MVADLKKLIIQQIRAAFPTVANVYDEPIQQGLKAPAFLVLIINDQQERKLGSQSAWEFMVNVIYFPSDSKKLYKESDAISQLFKQHFRYIANKYHVNNLEAIKQDGALVITFTVKMRVREVFEETKMNTLEVRL